MLMDVMSIFTVGILEVNYIGNQIAECERIKDIKQVFCQV